MWWMFIGDRYLGESGVTQEELNGTSAEEKDHIFAEMASAEWHIQVCP